jgi:hypothetical protein
VDAFFWNGSANPPLVQRIAAWMFGLLFIGYGLRFIAFAVDEPDGQDHPWIAFGTFMLLAVFCSLVGMRIFRNGFPRRQKALARRQ